MTHTLLHIRCGTYTICCTGVLNIPMYIPPGKTIKRYKPDVIYYVTVVILLSTNLLFINLRHRLGLDAVTHPVVLIY